MRYPTSAEIEEADAVQLARWLRFLSSPGMNDLDRARDGKCDGSTLEVEVRILDRIQERLRTFGGMTPEISKAIGWEE